VVLIVIGREQTPRKGDKYGWNNKHYGTMRKKVKEFKEKAAGLKWG